MVQQVGVVAGAIAAVAGAVGAVLALTGGPDPVPVATLKVTRFEPSVSFGAFAKRFPESVPPSLADEEPARPGGALFLDLTFQDFKGRSCKLTWTMHNEANQSPVDIPEFVDQAAGEFRMKSRFEHFTPPVWVPAPTDVQDVYLVLALSDGETPCGSPFRSKKIAVE